MPPLEQCLHPQKYVGEHSAEGPVLITFRPKQTNVYGPGVSRKVRPCKEAHIHEYVFNFCIIGCSSLRDPVAKARIYGLFNNCETLPDFGVLQNRCGGRSVSAMDDDRNLVKTNRSNFRGHASFIQRTDRIP